jgi:hypothetical protein
LRNIASYFRGRRDVDKLVKRFSADEREVVRCGVEDVMRIKAALDRLDDAARPTTLEEAQRRKMN